MVPELENIKRHQNLISALCMYVRTKLGYDRDPKLFFIINKNNAISPLARTAYYDPDEEKVGVYVIGRHIKDVLRSLAHELVHHAQHCRGDFKDTEDGRAGANYAQTDDHLREMEREAYEIGNMLFRDFEDGLKGQRGVEPWEGYTNPHIKEKV